MKRWIVILVIFCLSVPLVFASAPTWNKETEPTVKVVYEGGTAITDSLSTKSLAEKPAILTAATKTALTIVKYPYTITGTEITILKYRCTSETCGYWISATRDGKEVATNSPVWISPPPYEVVVSESLDTALNEVTVTVKEDPQLAVEQTLQRYVDRQPLGKAITGTKE